MLVEGNGARWRCYSRQWGGVWYWTQLFKASNVRVSKMGSREITELSWMLGLVRSRRVGEVMPRWDVAVYEARRRR